MLADGDAAIPDRLAFAEWLTNGRNPLTARVTVNRLWSRLFGTGIVRTEEDFGSSGEPPSHPALLDHLAVRFAGEWDWSVKRALRELVLTATYRQSATVRPAALAADPANRLLWRGPRRRLPAEAVRGPGAARRGAADRATARPAGPPADPRRGVEAVQRRPMGHPPRRATPGGTGGASTPTSNAASRTR